MLEVLGYIDDRRINSTNVFIQMDVKNYIHYAKQIIENNELQRRRVRTSRTVYSLLQDDLEKGCIMPPLVLAVSGGSPISEFDATTITEYINKNIGELLILDGLQRTYTLLDAEQTALEKKTEETFYSFPIRIELYVNINKFGVLYRMLTLNTGQTPMSTRHQIEMLYHDMLDKEMDGMKLVPEVDGTAKISKNEFSFKNTIDGISAYLNRNVLPMDRQDILDNVKALENMANEAMDKDLYRDFMKVYIEVFKTLNILYSGSITDEELAAFGVIGNPFGRTTAEVFSGSQAFTGFGSALGFMKERGIITGFEDIRKTCSEMKKTESDIEWFGTLIEKMDYLRRTSKKIGNAQRQYMHFLFRELFNPDSDSYANIQEAVVNGYNRYENMAV